MNERVALPPTLERISKIGPALTVLGLIGFCLGLAYINHGHPDAPVTAHWAEFYLYAWLIGMGYTLGCYGMMLLHYVLKSSWGYPVVRIWESGARLLPVMALLGLPLCFAAPLLYPWAQAQITDVTVLHRQGYMNPAAVLIRAVIYFALWIGTTYFLSGISRRLDETPNVELLRIRTNLSTFLLVVFVFSVNFAYTDWVMSLEKHWYSTIFGLWFVVSHTICGVGLVTILTMFCRKEQPYKETIDTGVRRDFGNLMLLAVMMWGYFSFSQWVIIWSGNLPDEIEFYLHRFTGDWLYVGAFIVVFQFFGPFVALLSGKTKYYPVLLGGIASWLLFMRLIDVGWTLFPSFSGSSPVYILVGIMAAIALMGVWLVLLVKLLRQAKLTTFLVPEPVEEALSNA